PIIVSDCPPAPPSTQYEYISAVSIKLKPSSTKASNSSNDFASSNVQPNTFPPKLNGATCKSVGPIVIFFILNDCFCLLYVKIIIRMWNELYKMLRK